MFTILKITAGATIAMAMLNPSFTPRSEDCECKADASAAQSMVPRADDCECKAEADSSSFRLVPR